VDESVVEITEAGHIEGKDADTAVSGDVLERPKVIVQCFGGRSASEHGVGDIKEMQEGVFRLGWSWCETLHIGPGEWSAKDLIVWIRRRGIDDKMAVRNVTDGITIIRLDQGSVIQVLDFISHVDTRRMSRCSVKRTRIANIDAAIARVSMTSPDVWLLVDRSHSEYLHEVIVSLQDAVQ
jgi:hypothetical protein